MNARLVVLAAAAALVLGLGVYLFREVRATPVVGDETAPRGKHVGETVQVSAPGGELTTPPKLDGERNTATNNPTARSVLPDRFRDRRDRETMDAGRPQIIDQLPGGGSARDNKPDANLIEAMSEANKSYDRGDFEEAKGIAQKVLAQNPGNVRMLRILVSSSCIDGDNDVAQNNYLLLPAADREQMKQRCARYGVTFPDKP